MAIFMRLNGVQGVNVEQIAEWAYSEKPVPTASGRRAAPKDGETTPAEAVLSPDSPPPVIAQMHVVFTDGHTADYAGEYAAALHRYFCTVGSALT